MSHFKCVWGHLLRVYSTAKGRPWENGHPQDRRRTHAPINHMSAAQFELTQIGPMLKKVVLGLQPNWFKKLSIFCRIFTGTNTFAPWVHISGYGVYPGWLLALCDMVRALCARDRFQTGWVNVSPRAGGWGVWGVDIDILTRLNVCWEWQSGLLFGTEEAVNCGHVYLSNNPWEVFRGSESF